MQNETTGRVRIEPVENGFQITIRARENWLLTAFFIYGLVLFLAAIPMIIAFLSTTSADFWSLSPFWAILLFGLVNSITLLLWNNAGQEVITFARGVITVERRIPYLVKRRAFPVGSNAQIRVAHEIRDREFKWWHFFWSSFHRMPYDPFPFLGGFQRGKIQFAYQRVSFRSFGLDLTAAEAESLLDRIRNLRGWGAPTK